MLHRKRSDYTRIKFLSKILFCLFDFWVDSKYINDSTSLWTIYSATTFLEKYIKEVLEKCFSKLFFWSTTFLEPDFLWIYGIKQPFFWPTTFLEPYFSNQISKNCKNLGCRIKGCLLSPIFSALNVCCQTVTHLICTAWEVIWRVPWKIYPTFSGLENHLRFSRVAT